MKKRWLAYATLVGAMAAAAVFGGTASGAARDYDACLLVPTVQLEKILGVAHIEVLNHESGASGPDNTRGYVKADCWGVGWSGSIPTTYEGSVQAVRSGRAVAWGISTWAPDATSPDAGNWTNGLYDTFTATEILLSVRLPHTPAAPAHQTEFLTPPSYGANDAEGFAWNPFAGVRAAMVAWMGDDNAMIMAVGVEQSASKPVVKHLNAIAKIAAANFGL